MTSRVGKEPRTSARAVFPAALSTSMLSLMLVISPGCVRRTLTINTDPQSATVVLNDEKIGTSPASVDFTWYGDYDVMIQREGYETLRTHRQIKPPWYQLPGIDFVSEALVPFWIHDRRELSFALEPAKAVAPTALRGKAQEFRERALYEGETGRTSPPAAGTSPAKSR